MPKQQKDKNKVKTLYIAMGVVLAAIAVWAIATSASSDPESNQSQANPEQQLPQDDYPGEQGYTQAPSYVGLSEAEAVKKAEDAGKPHRIVSRDGEQYPLTMDLRQDRVNFVIENNKVTSAEYY